MASNKKKGTGTVLKALLGVVFAALCVVVVTVGYMLGTGSIGTTLTASSDAKSAEEAASAGEENASADTAEGAGSGETSEVTDGAGTETADTENAAAADAAEAGTETAESAEPGETAEVSDGTSEAEAAENTASADAAETDESAGTNVTTKDGAAAASTQDPKLIAAREDPTFWDGCPKRNVQLLTPNPYSRPQLAISKVNTLVIHYVANPGSTAMENRDYFESLASGTGRSASAHFIIGLEGEIVQCIPISEVAYACGYRNGDTLSIECCHPNEDGKFNDSTYYSLVDLAGWLCLKLELNPQEIIRHYDVTEKNCPKYYVEHEDAWQQLKNDIETRFNYLKEQQAAA